MATRTYKTNLNCGSCVAAVRPILDGEKAISRWAVDTATPDRRLTVSGDDVGPERVAELVARAGFKVLGEVAPAAAPAPAPEAPAPDDGPPASYYPLALVLAFLLGLVALAEWRAGAFDWMRAMNHFMGGFFVAFAFFKLLDVPAFADAFSGYDILAARSRAYALAYPFIELALGVAYLANVWPVATNVVTLAVMLVGTVGVVQSLLARRKIRCACLGAVFNLPMSTVTLLEDLLMAGMAAFMLVAR
jgi:copper chaperone CopZ